MEFAPNQKSLETPLLSPLCLHFDYNFDAVMKKKVKSFIINYNKCDQNIVNYYSTFYCMTRKRS